MNSLAVVKHCVVCFKLQQPPVSRIFADKPAEAYGETVYYTDLLQVCYRLVG